jgi:hypothetical protein
LTGYASLTQPIWSTTLSYVGPRDAGRRALAVGAGTGKATLAFAARGVSILALEPDHAIAAVLSRHVADLPPQCRSCVRRSSGIDLRSGSGSCLPPKHGIGCLKRYKAREIYYTVRTDLNNPDIHLRSPHMDLLICRVADAAGSDPHRTLRCLEDPCREGRARQRLIKLKTMTSG